MDNNQSEKLSKQRLQRVHVSVGITISLFMYVVVFFGIFAMLLPYIQVWEKPSRHIQTVNITNVDYDYMVEPIISNPNFPTNNIQIILPGYQHDPVLKVTHQFVEPIIFNPTTKEKLQDEGDQSNLAMFLNGMHYGDPLKITGYTFFGLVSVGVMFLVLGGVLLIIKIKYKNTGKNTVSKFSKWHRKIFSFVFPPFIIITLTGALMLIGYTSSAPMTYLASKGKTHDIFTLTYPVLFPDIQSVQKENVQAQMIPISQLIKKAQEVNPEIDYEKLTLINWKDKSAQVKLEGYNPYMPFLNGISNKPSVTLSAVDGEVLQDLRVLDKHWSGLFFDSIYFLHLLFGVDNFTRLFLVSVMITTTFAIGFGVLLWLEKKAKKFPRNIPFYHWMGKLSLSVMIGVLPATGVLFALQWLLPFDLKDRFIWQEGIFFISWLATLTWSFYRINSYHAAKEFFAIAGVLFMISPLIHFFNSQFTPSYLWENELFTILSVDIGLFIFGLILITIGIILPKETKKIQDFWIKNL